MLTLSLLAFLLPAITYAEKPPVITKTSYAVCNSTQRPLQKAALQCPKRVFTERPPVPWKEILATVVGVAVWRWILGPPSDEAT